MKKIFLSLCVALSIGLCDCFWSDIITHNDSRKKKISLYYVCLKNVLYVASLNNDYLSVTTIQGLTPILNKRGLAKECKCYQPPKENEEENIDENI